MPLCQLAALVEPHTLIPIITGKERGQTRLLKCTFRACLKSEMSKSVVGWRLWRRRNKQGCKYRMTLNDEAIFCVGNSELLAAMLVCQFTVVNFDMSTSNKRVDWLRWWQLLTDVANWQKIARFFEKLNNCLRFLISDNLHKAKSSGAKNFFTWISLLQFLS